MSNPLCVAWKRVMDNPSDAEALTGVRDRLDELLDHVDECPDCLDASQSSEHQEAALIALGAFADEPSAEELAEYEALEQAWSDDEEQIREAVTSVLLPSLPWDIRNEVAALGPDVEPLRLFLATNAVSLLVFSRASDSSLQRLSLSRDGFDRNGDLEVAAETIVSEIARHAGLQQDSARAVFDWMLRAADYAPKLFLHFVATRSDGQVALRLDEPSLKHDLFERWVPVRKAKGIGKSALESWQSDSRLLAAASADARPPAPGAAAAPRAKRLAELKEREDKAEV